MSSLLDDDFRNRETLYESWNLRGNPFHKDPPADDVIPKVFVGRDGEIRRAARAAVDMPRNVMIRGGYGMGKTTFVRRLLHELNVTQRMNFLVAYGALVGERPVDFYRAVLKALAESLRNQTEEAESICSGLMRNESYDHPDMHIRSLLGKIASSYDRVVVAIDELDKRPVRISQEIIVQCRPLFDLGCSFLVPGRPLDAMGHVDSSVFGAFDLAIDLEPFDRQSSREILRRNLDLFRLHTQEQDMFHPFEESVVARLVADARGIPRVIHVLALDLLEGATEDTAAGKGPVNTIGLGHYEAYLVRNGAGAYAGTDQRAREVIRTFDRHGGNIDLRNLAEYLDDGFPLDQNLDVVESLTHNDMLVKTESAVSVQYALQPTIESFLRREQQWKENLAGIWRDVRAKTSTANERGCRLENFAGELFGRVFRVANSNLNTQTEELDLVLEYPGGRGAWARTPLALVECKNWSTRLPQAEVSALATKARLDDFSLVFVLSFSGFTKDARFQAERVRQRDRLPMVLIEGTDIEGFLGNEETADDFLQRMERISQLNVR